MSSIVRIFHYRNVLIFFSLYKSIESIAKKLCLTPISKLHFYNIYCNSQKKKKKKGWIFNIPYRATNGNILILNKTRLAHRLVPMRRRSRYEDTFWGTPWLFLGIQAIQGRVVSETDKVTLPFTDTQKGVW